MEGTLGPAIQEKRTLWAHGMGWLRTLPGNLKDSAESIKKLGRDDPRRVVHSLKVALALTFVSFLYYFRPIYNSFGSSALWAVLTVVVVFEFTVGATLSKGLNRGFATFVAGALGVEAHQLANLTGESLGEPILLGIFVFLIAAASTFARFSPPIKARYDYGVLIFILTFSLVTVSGYRVDEIFLLAHQRLSTIGIGAGACIIISVLVCPVWAGEELHKQVVLNLEMLATYLEGFGSEHFKLSQDGGNTVDDKEKKPCLEVYKCLLGSKPTEETLANFARWEPGHGRFRFRHPWKQYLKIGFLTRQCACQIEALNGYTTSNHEPQEFERTIGEHCIKMSSASGKALKALATGIKTMTDISPAMPHVRNYKAAIGDLRAALRSVSLDNLDLLRVLPSASVASILTETVTRVDDIVESVMELSKLAHFTVNPTTTTAHKPMLVRRGSIKPISERDGRSHIVIAIPE